MSCGCAIGHPRCLEKGAGVVKGQNIDLQGSWKDDTRQYEAKYSGTFVRRSAQLKGTQSWTDGGKTVTRACSGAIKRPLKPFLPRNKPAGVTTPSAGATAAGIRTPE